MLSNGAIIFSQLKDSSVFRQRNRYGLTHKLFKTSHWILTSWYSDSKLGFIRLHCLMISTYYVASESCEILTSNTSLATVCTYLSFLVVVIGGLPTQIVTKYRTQPNWGRCKVSVHHYLVLVPPDITLNIGVKVNRGRNSWFFIRKKKILQLRHLSRRGIPETSNVFSLLKYTQTTFSLQQNIKSNHRYQLHNI